MSGVEPASSEEGCELACFEQRIDGESGDEIEREPGTQIVLSDEDRITDEKTILRQEQNMTACAGIPTRKGAHSRGWH